MIAVSVLVVCSVAIVILLCDTGFWGRIEDHDKQRWN